MFTWIFCPILQNTILKACLKILELISVYLITCLSLAFPEANRLRSPHGLPFHTIPRHSQCEFLDLSSWIPGGEGRNREEQAGYMTGMSTGEPWNFQSREQIISICCWLNPRQNPKHLWDAGCHADSKRRRWSVESGKRATFFMSWELRNRKRSHSPGHLHQCQHFQLLCSSARC